MMRRFIGLLFVGVMAILSQGLVAQEAVKKADPKAKVEVKKFSSKEQDFAIAFPVGKVEKVETKIGEGMKDTLTMYVVEVGAEEAYIVSENRIPAKNSVEEALNGAQKGMVGKAKLVSSKKITFGPKKLPGREVVVDKGDEGMMRSRMILNGTRFYQVMTVGSEKHIQSAKVTAFLDSFEILSLKPATVEKEAKDKRFHEKEAGYKIAFPGKTDKQVQQADTPAGKMTITMHLHKGDGNAYIVSHNNVPGVMPGIDGDVILGGSQKGVIGDGTLVSSKKLAFGPDKVPAREFVYDTTKNGIDMRFRALILYRNETLYQVLVGGQDDFGDTKAAKDFLKSFEFTKKDD
ncbi:MAG: hypothetical protein ACRC8S_11590 [Fimbriiglobus sp.]